MIVGPAGRFNVTSAAIAACLGLAVSTPILAQQAVQWRVEDGGNGHWYALYDHGSLATRGRHASTAWSRGASLAGFELAGEDQAVVNLLAAQIADMPAGTQVLLGGLAQCFTATSCDSFWGTGQSPIGSGWAAGEPAEAPGVQLVFLTPAANLTIFSANSRFSLWEWSTDCDEDGVIDLTAIQSGAVLDADGNQIPDSCDSYRAANMVQNGSFEANPDGQCCTTVSAWSGFVDRVDAEWFPADGGVSVDLNTGSAQSIQQNIAISQTGYYRLSFSYSGNCGDCGAGFLRRFRVTLGAFTEVVELDTAGWFDPAQPWLQYDRVIQLESGSHVLKLQSLLGGCTGPAVDRIAVRSNADCDSDGLPDVEAFRMRLVSDTNANGVPDCCEAGVSCDPCPGDLNASNTVDAEDLAYVLFAWETDGGKTPEADIDRSGTVDANDLSIVLGSWGPCP